MKISTHALPQFSKRFNRSGFTLIEISLVIALLLGLIAVAFLGLGSYRKGSDRAKCQMQLAAVQKAVRASANMSNMNIGDALVEADVFGAGKILENTPVCPAGGGYTWAATLPALGTPYGNCDFDDDNGTDHILEAGDTTDW